MIVVGKGYLFIIGHIVNVFSSHSFSIHFFQPASLQIDMPTVHFSY